MDNKEKLYYQQGIQAGNDARDQIASDKYAKGHGILTKTEIQTHGLIRNGKTEAVEDIKNGCYQTASYDLCLGSCHYVFGNSNEERAHKLGWESEKSGWTLIHIGDDEDFNRLNENSDETQKYRKPERGRHILTIPPYGSAIIELKEYVDTYTVAAQENLLVTGRFDLKLSKVYQALISQQATQVEPLYYGRLYCFIHNLGDKSVRIKEGDKVATIEFSYAGMGLSEEERKNLIEEQLEPLEKYKESKYTTKYGIEEVRWFYDQNRLPVDCGMYRLFHKLDKDAKDVRDSMETTFEQYVAKEDTMNRIADSVGLRIQERHKTQELALAGGAALLTFGLGGIIWGFYQELVKLSGYQEILAGLHTEESVSNMESVLEHLECVGDSLAALPIAMIIIYTILFFVFFGMIQSSIDSQEKMKEKIEKTYNSNLEKRLEKIDKDFEDIYQVINTYPELGKELKKTKESHADEANGTDKKD